MVTAGVSDFFGDDSLFIASCIPFLAAVNLSRDDNPRHPNASSATASTKYGAGAISSVLKLL
jgi:hypothetical protein